MKNIMKNEIINVENMIYEINGVEVMLDSDLANLYQVETKRINEAVKNNPDKFPIRFSWVLSIEQTIDISRSKFSTLKVKQGTNVKYGARVFTEQGIYMLATILKSKVATEVSIRIMDTFVKMRHYINYNKRFLPHRYMLLEDKVNENTKRIDELFDKFNPKEITKNSIFFENDIYDAYSVLIDILNSAKEEIIIIDNYASKELLDMLRVIKKPITIVSKNFNESLKRKYNAQYKNVVFIKNESFHDRFIIIDRKKLYSCGASFKDLGKKCFAICSNDNKEYLEELLKIINI